MLFIEDDLSYALGVEDEPFIYARGPFIVEPSDDTPPYLGIDLMQSGLNITLWDGGSGKEFSDEEYTVSVNDEGTEVTFEGIDSDTIDIKIKPASYEELQEFYNYLEFSSDDEARNIIYGLMQRIAGAAFGIYTGGKLTDLGLVVDEDSDIVIGLYIINNDGTFMRENEAWVAIDPDDEEADEVIESGYWEEVLDGAVPLFDSLEDNDEIHVEEFSKFIL